jgi:hypothetical protein
MTARSLLASVRLQVIVDCPSCGNSLSPEDDDAVCYCCRIVFRGALSVSLGSTLRDYGQWPAEYLYPDDSPCAMGWDERGPCVLPDGHRGRVCFDSKGGWLR